MICLRRGFGSIVKKFNRRFKKEGFFYLVVLWRVFVNYIVRFFRNDTFVFQNKRYKYFYDAYNHTWANERAIEIPIILGELRKSKVQFLEIGNVLGHYVDIPHEVIDKYDVSPGVINDDAATFQSKNKNSLIISISTLEHVGIDEEPKEQDKINLAIQNIIRNLKEGGKSIITVPIGYNCCLDKLIEEGKLFSHRLFFKRRLFNVWKQCDWEDVKASKFSEDARGLAILYIEK
ncbi:MAG: hypothetical protein KKE50_04685 [Nanoarchaeota archaeon]|nr:hypothetical protein [Nanoarchaeota archaeon]